MLGWLSIRRHTLKANADLEYRAGVLSWPCIRRNTCKMNADLECRAGVLSWLSIQLNALKRMLIWNVVLEC
ncbi:hypothetical protein DPMN_158551 [Dreissena polymorpha]|uniref:Uncharacterized protein n=1 Tax=Dreissena polymorpha TaxID=45954 RepID=A0A9D4EJ74_DREPO|nr:hypothetical protein DPMN_158551 [Dreissena polymorpha]